MEEFKNQHSTYEINGNKYIIYHNPTTKQYWVLKDNVLVVQVQENESIDYFVQNPFADEKIDDENFSDYTKFKNIISNLIFKDIDPPICTYEKQKYDEFTSFSFQAGPDHKLKTIDIARNVNYIVIKHCDKYCSNDYLEFDRPFVAVTKVNENGHLFIVIYPLRMLVEEEFDPSFNYSITIFNCLHNTLLKQLNWMLDPILFHVKSLKLSDKPVRVLHQISVKEIELTDKWNMLIHESYHKGVYEFIHITFENN